MYARYISARKPMMLDVNIGAVMLRFFASLNELIE